VHLSGKIKLSKTRSCGATRSDSPTCSRLLPKNSINCDLDPRAEVLNLASPPSSPPGKPGYFLRLELLRIVPHAASYIH
jgi:hypothetical protein